MLLLKMCWYIVIDFLKLVCGWLSLVMIMVCGMLMVVYLFYSSVVVLFRLFMVEMMNRVVFVACNLVCSLFM